VDVPIIWPFIYKDKTSDDSGSSGRTVWQIVAVALIQHSVGARGKQFLYVVCISDCV
jgi:hypothetical protein